MQNINIDGLDLLLSIIVFAVNYRRIYWKRKFNDLESYRIKRRD